MLIKSISKISLADQLPKKYFIEGAETEDIKRKTGYISVENLETYMEEYLAGNLPKYFAAYQEQIDELREMVAELKDTIDGEKPASPRNVMRGSSGADTVFGSTIRRKEVISISFDDKFPESLSDFEKYWDVSEYGDGSVIAYAKRCGEYYEIYICGAGGVIAPTSCNGLFVSYHNLYSIRFHGVFDTSRVTDMGSMFSGCKSLKELDVGGFDTSHVTNMDSMFCWCKSLQNLDVGSFNTSQVTNMNSMFCWCESLESLDISSFDISKVTDMRRMFWWCENLEKLDMSGFDTSRVTSMDDMFRGCKKLQI